MNPALAGKRVLIVEDDFLNGLHLEQTLASLGCTAVGPCVSVDEGLAAVANDHLDAAILDVKVRGGTSIGVARALEQRGVPYIYLTGHRASALQTDGVPPEAIVAKPAEVATLVRALVTQLERARCEEEANDAAQSTLK